MSSASASASVVASAPMAVVPSAIELEEFFANLHLSVPSSSPARKCLPIDQYTSLQTTILGATQTSSQSMLYRDWRDSKSKSFSRQMMDILDNIQNKKLYAKLFIPAERQMSAEYDFGVSEKTMEGLMKIATNYLQKGDAKRALETIQLVNEVAQTSVVMMTRFINVYNETSSIFRSVESTIETDLVCKLKDLQAVSLLRELQQKVDRLKDSLSQHEVLRLCIYDLMQYAQKRCFLDNCSCDSCEYGVMPFVLHYSISPL